MSIVPRMGLLINGFNAVSCGLQLAHTNFTAVLVMASMARDHERPPLKWTPGYAAFRSACSGVM
ncbi:hypothetical protein UCD39_28355 [Nitrospirillum sp. BR 11752]|uniref:hypothetical protein n=1 Tax=Nitrospirillum sp. BR 11752 TaxID=3104293 RepID=UPI002EB8D069|nr:hypothetical protein [Nitrospirillum sp. BR 11752]